MSLGAFAIGTTEFASMGLLPQIARDLDVSIPQAGMLITLYALGVVVGAPLVTIAGLDFAGLLGGAYLANYIVTIDYPGRRLTLRTNP